MNSEIALLFCVVIAAIVIGGCDGVTLIKAVSTTGRMV